jgi:hypothetical protein
LLEPVDEQRGTVLASLGQAHAEALLPALLAKGEGEGGKWVGGRGEREREEEEEVE